MRAATAVVADEERTFIETARRAQIVQAAIDTIAEVGYSRASLARICARIGVSKGLIAYHFAGKDDLIKQVVEDVIAEGLAYMHPRILAETTGSGMLRAYIESNLSFIGSHRNAMVAIVEIARNDLTDGAKHFYGNIEVDHAVRNLEQLLVRFQASGELRPDFDPTSMAVAIRAAIDVVPRLLVTPDFDVDSYAREISEAFDRATRIAP